MQNSKTACEDATDPVFCNSIRGTTRRLLPDDEPRKPREPRDNRCEWMCVLCILTSSSSQHGTNQPSHVACTVQTQLSWLDSGTRSQNKDHSWPKFKFRCKHCGLSGSARLHKIGPNSKKSQFVKESLLRNTLYIHIDFCSILAPSKKVCHHNYSPATFDQWGAASLPDAWSSCLRDEVLFLQH